MIGVDERLVEETAANRFAAAGVPAVRGADLDDAGPRLSFHSHEALAAAETPKKPSVLGNGKVDVIVCDGRTRGCT